MGSPGGSGVSCPVATSRTELVVTSGLVVGRLNASSGLPVELRTSKRTTPAVTGSGAPPAASRISCCWAVT